MSPSHVTLIVKTTRLCNLRCTYCNDWRTGSEHTMEFSVLARMISRVLLDPQAGSVEFIWHGGEPTILGLDFYRKALLVQSRFRRCETRVVNCLQTNGTLIDEEWIRFIRAYNFQVGLSLDGPSLLHNCHRSYASGRGSFDDVLSSIRRLRDNGVRASILVVVDRDTLRMGPDGLFDFLVEHGLLDVGVLAVRPENAHEPGRKTDPGAYIPPGEMNSFLADLYDRCNRPGSPRLRVRELDMLAARIGGAEPRSCVISGECFGRYFAVEPNGDVAHCDVFLGDETYTLGSIEDHAFSDLRRFASEMPQRAEHDAAKRLMRSCPEFGICRGWCPHERYLSLRHNKEYRDDCCGLRDLISHIRGRLAERERQPLVAEAVERRDEDLVGASG